MLLSGKEKKHLRSLAHELKAKVYVGTDGVSDNFIKAINENLKANELVKVKFVKFKEQKKELTKIIEQKTNAINVGLLGNVLILYKKNKDLKKSIDLSSI